MPINETFLDSEELGLFAKPQRKIEREVRAIPPLTEEGEAQESFLLSQAVSSLLNGLLNTGKVFSQTSSVKVLDNDGMTWSAETVRQTVSNVAPAFKHHIWRDFRPVNSLPEIATLVGERTFLNLAIRHGLMPSSFKIISLSHIAWLALALAGGLLVSVSEFVLKVFSKSKTWDVLENPAFYIGAFAVILGKMLYEFLRKKSSPKTKSEAISEFCKADVSKVDPVSMDAFVNAVSGKLRAQVVPRIVIIDNYDHLTTLSKSILKNYFTQHASSCLSSEFWVIFERTEGERFSTLADTYTDSPVLKSHKNYEQIELDQEERSDLGNLLGRPERAQFTRVKLICGFDDADQVQVFLRQYRREHPHSYTSYGPLELFYLLSFSTLYDSEFSDLDWLISRLADKNAKRNNVLSEILRGTRFTLQEFRNGISRVRSDFNALLQAKQNDGRSTFRLIANDNSYIVALADELQLPQPELCQLFWSLLIWDQIQSRFPESFWMRKLSYHLLNSGIRHLRTEETYQYGVNATFTALSRTADGCLRTALFDKVKPLLERGLDVLDDEALNEPRKRRHEFLRASLNAYSVLGDERLMELMISAIKPLADHASSSVTADSIPLTIFLDSTPLIPAVRDTVTYTILDSVPGDSELQSSIKDYARLRGMWFAFTIAPFLHTHHQALSLVQAIVISNETLARIFDRTTDRIQRAGTGVSPVDVLTLALCVWLEALTFDRAIRRWQYINVREDELGVSNIVSRFRLMVDHIETLLVVHYVMSEDTEAGEIIKTKRAKAISSIRRDFLTESLLHDLGGTALSSLLVAVSLTQEEAVIDKELIEKVNVLISEIGHVLGQDVASLRIDNRDLQPDVLACIENHFNISRTLWYRVGLQHLHDQVNIRRSTFGLLTGPPAGDAPQRLDKLVYSLRTTLEDVSFIGLLANLLMANVAREVEELRSLFLSRSADFGNGKSIGVDLKRELAILCFCSTSDFSQASLRLARFLMGDEKVEASALFKFVENAEESEYEFLLLRMINLVTACGDSDLYTRANEMLTSFLAVVSSEELKREIELMRDYWVLHKRILENETIDFAEVKEQWKNSKDSKWYATILGKMIESGEPSEELLNECYGVLSVDPDNQSFNHYFLLAQTVATYIALNRSNLDSVGVIVNHLVTGYSKFKDITTVDSKIHTMWLLSEQDPERSNNYEFEHQKLLEVKTEIDHVRRYPQLAKQGKYYLIFEDYFRTLHSFALPCDLDKREVLRAWRMSDDEKGKAVNLWVESGANIPAPITILSGTKVVSGNFLVLGHHLFSRNLFPESSYDSYRNDFNRAAHDSLRKLLDIILCLDSLPTGISQIIRKWGQELHIVG